MKHADGTECRGETCAWKGDGGHVLQSAKPKAYVNVTDVNGELLGRFPLDAEDVDGIRDDELLGGPMARGVFTLIAKVGECLPSSDNLP